MSSWYAFKWIWASDEKEGGYSNTRYIVYDADKWRCLLCNTGNMRDRVVHSHLNGHRHSNKYASLKEAQIILLKDGWCSQNIVPSINELGLDRWKWHLNHLCH